MNRIYEYLSASVTSGQICLSVDMIIKLIFFCHKRSITEEEIVSGNRKRNRKGCEGAKIGQDCMNA